jgi:hypothetical protein
LNELVLKPILIVNDIVFNKLKNNKDLLNNLYSDTKIKEGKIYDVELETFLTMLFNVLNRNELEELLFDSGRLLTNISKKIDLNPTLRSQIIDFLSKHKKVANVYNDVTGRNNLLKKKLLTDVKKNYLLDLKTRYSVLTKEDIIDLGSFSVLKVDDELIHMLKTNYVNDEVYNLLYGIFLNTCSITSSTDFNKKISSNILGSILPYIKTMHSGAA